MATRYSGLTVKLWTWFNTNMGESLVGLGLALLGIGLPFLVTTINDKEYHFTFWMGLFMVISGTVGFSKGFIRLRNEDKARIKREEQIVKDISVWVSKERTEGK